MMSNHTNPAGIRSIQPFLSRSLGCLFLSVCVAIASQSAFGHTLNMSVSPAGSGSVSILPDASGSYVNGTQITLTATPTADFTFVQWQGFPINGIAATSVTFTITQNLTITAQFVRRPAEWISPSGVSEPFDVGELIDIRWDLHDSSIPFVNIQLSTDGGSTYPVSLASNYPNSEERFDWLAPVEYDGYDRLRLRVIEVGGGGRLAQMDAPFAITDSGGSELILRSPNGGESYTEGKTQLVKWQYRGSATGDSIRIEYSTNNGSAWTTVASRVDIKQGAYAWSIPPEPTTQARIRITADGSTGANDMSASPFTVIAATATELAVDKTQLFFEHYLGATSVSSQPIIVSNAGPGSFDFTLSNSVAPSPDFTAYPTADYQTSIGGSFEATVSVSLSVTELSGLSASTVPYHTYFLIQRADDPTDQALINVQVLVKTPKMTLSETVVTFTHVIGAANAPDNQTLTLSTNNPGAFDWRIQIDNAGTGAFLNVSPFIIFPPVSLSASQLITVSIDETALDELEAAPGVYSARFTVINETDNDAEIAVNVTLNVRYPALILSDTIIVFEYLNDDVLPASQSLTVSTLDPLPVTMSISSVDAGDPAFMTLLPATVSSTIISSSDSFVLTIGVNTSVLASISLTGDYLAGFSVLNETAGITHPVRVILRYLAGDIAVSTPTLTFTATESETPANRIISVSNIGRGVLDFSLSYTAAGSRDFLVFPDGGSGSLIEGASMNLTIGVDTTGLAQGQTYRSQFRLINDMNPADVSVVNVELVMLSGSPVIRASAIKLTINHVKPDGVSPVPDAPPAVLVFTNNGLNSRTVTIAVSDVFPIAGTPFYSGTGALYEVSATTLTIPAGQSVSLTVLSKTNSLTSPFYYAKGMINWTASGADGGSGQVELLTLITKIPIEDDDPKDTKPACNLSNDRFALRGLTLLSAASLVALALVIRRGSRLKR